MRFREFLESYDKLGTGIKKGHTLEARGTKGEDKKEWAKSFKDKAELDKWVKDNDAKVFGIAYAEKVTESVGQTPWEIICDIVEKDHGEESLVDLAIAEAGRILNLGKADEIAGKEFFDLPVGKMKALVNAHPELLKGKAASRYKKQLTEASPGKDGIMPLSYKAGKGHKIEAYGVKGMKSASWRKTFKDEDALDKWVDANDAEVHGTRELKESVEKTSFEIYTFASEDEAEDLTRADVSAIAKVLKSYGYVEKKELSDDKRELTISVEVEEYQSAAKLKKDLKDDVYKAVPTGYEVKVR